MFFNGSDSATITNSQIIFNGTNKTFLSGNTATGLLFDTSDITIDNLDIEMNAVVSGGTFIITGINSVTGASNPTPIKLSNSTINVNLTDTNSIAAEADGIVDTNDIYEIFNSQISTNVNVTNNSGSADAFTRAIDINGSTAVLDIQDSQVSANASATGSTTGNSDSAAIRTSFMTAANIENSQLVSTANAQGTTGAFATSTGFISNFTPVTVTNSVLDVRSNTSGTTTGSSQAVGMSLNGGSLNQTGNTFNVVATGTTPTSQTDIIGP
ncbi:MAG: hypothetical protein HWD59_03520 [Coxiellaceae bacterium]|nr:MAG: hypothetical protein HWD59_03520 [Coxiellaceae bacterium]